MTSTSARMNGFCFHAADKDSGRRFLFVSLPEGSGWRGSEKLRGEHECKVDFYINSSGDATVLFLSINGRQNSRKAAVWLHALPTSEYRFLAAENWLLLSLRHVRATGIHCHTHGDPAEVLISAPMAISGNCRCVVGPHFPEIQRVSPVFYPLKSSTFSLFVWP